MINRLQHKLMKLYSREFRSIAVVGPRQSGKTTLVKETFSQKPYVSLENPDDLRMALTDPRGFLARFPKGAILDEAQRAPELFRYIQQIIDESEKDGLFILTGSNNFLMQESISQSLAGRIGYIDLLPLSYDEIASMDKRIPTTSELILKGFYPEVYAKNRSHELWYPSYIRTYVERDVKQLRNIDDTQLFTKFLRLCAGRIGQILSVAALANECGIDVRTVNAWLGILQSSYIVFLLPPHYANYNKRLVKAPKLYFYDTGVATSLLGLKTKNELELSSFKGALFENMVILDMMKRNLNFGTHARFYYWRDNNGTEIDLILELNGKTIPIEIKSSQTFNEEFLKPMMKWKKYSGINGGILFYDGELESADYKDIRLANWKNHGKYVR